jgi:hypothetical protein
MGPLEGRTFCLPYQTCQLCHSVAAALPVGAVASVRGWAVSWAMNMHRQD